MFNRHAGRSVIACLLLASAPAVAQDPAGDLAKRRATARTLADKARALFDANHWQEAYDQFRAADEIYHAPTLTLYMALSLSEMGKLLEARELYQKLLTEPLPKDAPPQFAKAYESARVQLEALKSRVPSIQVIVTGLQHERANVFLDGSALPEGPREVNPGSHKIEARPIGGEPIVKVVTLAAGDTRKIEVMLRKPEPIPATRPKPVEPMSSRRNKEIIISGAALSAAALGMGIGFTAWSNSAASESNSFRQQCVGGNSAACGEFTDPDRTRALAGNVAIWSFISAGTVALGTATYALVSPLVNRAPKVSVLAGPGMAAASVTVAW